jgi:hypothetical protein
LLVHDFAYWWYAGLAGDEDDEGLFLAVDVGEDCRCGARLLEFSVFVDEGYGPRLYFVIAGETAFDGDGGSVASLLL